MISIISVICYLLLAPFAGCLLDGVDRILTARMQGRKGPRLLQPFYDIGKLFHIFANCQVSEFLLSAIR